MSDPLYLSLWFPGFEIEEMAPHALSVMRQFPFSGRRPGIQYLKLQPVSWNEPTILERRFEPGVDPEEAIAVASDMLHEDYAYGFEAYWDLASPDESSQWISQPSAVKFVVHGLDFEEGVYEQEGHILIDFGLDQPFLHEELKLTSQAETQVRANVQKLVEIIQTIEKNSGASARLLWSESEESLPQKLISRLQKVQ